MGLWSGVNDADVFERGKYMKDGFIGKVRIKRTLAKETRKVGLAFIVELEIVTSNMEEHPVGSKGTWFQKMTDKAVAFPAVKGFVTALFGYQPHQKEEIDADVAPNLEAILDHACQSEDDNHLTNMIVNLECVKIQTQKGFDFTRYDWSPAE
jgi:hypothetical protein